MIPLKTYEMPLAVLLLAQHLNLDHTSRSKNLYTQSSRSRKDCAFKDLQAARVAVAAGEDKILGSRPVPRGASAILF